MEKKGKFSIIDMLKCIQVTLSIFVNMLSMKIRPVILISLYNRVIMMHVHCADCRVLRKPNHLDDYIFDS